MSSSAKGILVAVEGIDGAGKSTLVNKLGELLAQKGHSVTLTREPTDGVFGQRIRELAKSGRHALSPEEELDLFIEDRREHVQRVIKPNLEKGKIVITDRYYLSSVAYQSVRGLDPKAILAANLAFAPRPDLVILLDLSVEEGLDRIVNSRGEPLTEFERKKSLARVRDVFISLVDERTLRLDARRSLEELVRAAANAVEAILR